MNHSVLFVDDDKVALKMVKTILESAGFIVTLSSDPRDALEQLARGNFDIFISDANMPGGISGFDLVKTIRSQKQYDKMAVALLTGRREKKDIKLGLDSGADDYIVKPIDPDILLAKVEGLLKKKNPSTITRFAERPVRSDAFWEITIQITYISERGINLWVPFAPPIDSRLQIRSDFFGIVGIEPPFLRVVAVNKAPHNDGMYFAITQFIGANDSELQKIRQWINTSGKLEGKAS